MASRRIPLMNDAPAARTIAPWRSAKIALAALAALHVAGCDHFPQDPGSTLETIRDQGVVRVGIERPVPPEAARLLQRIERATGAEARISQGGVEPLLAQLDAGEIDLLIAPFGKQTPWATKAALSPPVRVEGQGEDVTEWRAAMRSGENRWIMLVETEARRVSGAPDAS
ncbi:MAG: hypothetical protein JHC57_07725 [Sphingopyxis sp.]|uniref:hypothetical protein n=1 Tax=Sphingopyxis sp. TaxID=1908224 RepID=UPI001A217C15|nr:hypothetical protein [Sphingopyxis sp.]MBJ7499626.1 hypothetical protein [Sphingopyxis sp.]